VSGVVASGHWENVLAARAADVNHGRGRPSSYRPLTFGAGMPRHDTSMGSNSFLTRLAIVFFVIIAIMGLVHMGGGHATKSFFMKIHGH
jgi:hypothetical protein